MATDGGARFRWGVAGFVFLLALLACPWTGVDAARAEGGTALTADEFHIWSPQGFGDRHNHWAWSMVWWKDALYVGTTRDPMCVNQRMLNIGFPFIPYPTNDPDLDCAANPDDLPLAAEIWRWHPDTDLWERVYRSPEDLPIPETDKFVARDIGYRGFQLFTDPDGTEALYASGVSARSIQHKEPRPFARILRSEDGEHFDPVPQDPGTFLGDLQNASFRGMTTFKDRLYILAGTYTGPGTVLESADPALGNDAFREVVPEGMRVMELQAYNDQLYLGLRDTEGRGYSVVRTDAEGDVPYAFTTVVPPGAGIQHSPNTDVLSMVEFKGYLYCGANGIGNDVGSPNLTAEETAAASAEASAPEEENRYVNAAELIRVHPDDSWDLIVGRPRNTEEGFRVPWSGFSSGFNHPFNNHMWRMVVHEDVLYVGTYDSSTVLKETPLRPLLENVMGFDLFASTDGVHFRSITRDGFGHPLQVGCRNLISTPYGLFLGTATFYYGSYIFRGMH